jgi:hypothetical protein
MPKLHMLTIPADHIGLVRPTEYGDLLRPRLST